MIRLTRNQVREIDRRAIQDYHIPGIVLMENAAIAAADEAEEMLQQSKRRDVLILCGGGNNGGDGLAVARHLHNRGMNITIGLTIDPEGYKGDALTNWQIVQAMKLNATPFSMALLTARPALIVDAIFGTGLSQAPRDPFAQIAEQVNFSNIPVLAIDLPSGLDCDTGKPLGACIRATRTVTFAAEKVGFAKPQAAEFLGALRVASIGCPLELVDGAVSF